MVGRRLLNGGYIWDEAALYAWIASPQAFVPGNGMKFKGMPDPQMRADLIAYLAQAGQGGAPLPQGGMMNMGAVEVSDLKTLGPDHQVAAIRHCEDTYEITTADGTTEPFWEMNLRFRTDGSERGPKPDQPVIVSPSMAGYRASVVFASPQETAPLFGRRASREGIATGRNRHARHNPPPLRCRSCPVAVGVAGPAAAPPSSKSGRCGAAPAAPPGPGISRRRASAQRTHELDDLAPVRAEAGVPADLGGCHTAKVPGYVVEGHVPVEAVQRLLAERPAILGLAVPGMPMNSPGMEIEGEQGEPFDVIAFAADGRARCSWRCGRSFCLAETGIRRHGQRDDHP